ncbi:TPA: peptidase S8 [bacterium]|nr:peptidase S8 [bacterium]
MQRLIYLLLFMMGLFLLVSLTSYAKDNERWIVIFDKSMNEDDENKCIKESGGNFIKNIPIIKGKVITADNKKAEALKNKKGVIRIDPDVIVNAHAQTLPWGVNRIDADLAWKSSSGSGVKVGIIDTGISTVHKDLKVYGGINTINGISYNDDNGHGSHVAGIVSALNNTSGVVGVAYNARLYAIKALNSSGSGYLSDIIEGLDWCINNGIKVINMSLGTSSNVKSFEDAVKKVYSLGIVMVASAGNSSGGAVSYPAAYAEVIAVSATNTNDSIASFSSIGPEVELSAPGVNIYSTYKSTSFAYMSGTSMAAPHVTGTVALLLAKGITGIEQIRNKLISTADDLGTAGFDPKFGFGLVDAQEAVTDVQTLPAPPNISGKTTITWGEAKSR